MGHVLTFVQTRTGFNMIMKLIFSSNFQRVEQAKRLSEDKMMEQLQWYRPEPLDVLEIMERGTNSQEKISQVCYCCCFVVVVAVVWCSCCL